ncbi:BZ3500_MvSof-1268-A1-R1_Chr10-1g02614 [Microbotryum saponariae]|uniref:BZ3500_MvSof-1268-A1-R1_Chr10-1g02614 protein n=1 Tax=Microbotryum saponariae TaxID=289078 RepID=A0A2X0M2F8_9BASI|nr:BZ3500_MvSof-1268-A1-R1_Chr10-1g02614 [Microbotryum saponariae]SDA06103.1 BZ3501_MvSof-1269-A2-R1_Chr10-1g02215 [Microbotryum saponariae]
MRALLGKARQPEIAFALRLAFSSSSPRPLNQLRTMGKTGKAIKRRKLAEATALATKLAAPELFDDHSGDDLDSLADSPPSSTARPTASAPLSKDFLQGLISPSHLAVTVKTLNALVQHPELLKDTASKTTRTQLKGLRTALFDVQRLSSEVNQATGTSLTSRISSALSQSRYTDALVLLSEMRIREQQPKLGALQRWVRECDCASRADGSFGDQDVLKVLDAILRCCNGVTPRAIASNGDIVDEGSVVKRHDEWVYRTPSGLDLYGEIKQHRLPLPSQRLQLAKAFRLLQTTPGPERLPPNHHPAYQYTSQPGSIPLDLEPATLASRAEVPNVPGAFILLDILSPDECKTILAGAESVGFSPDRPLGPQTSVLAHNLYWLADKEFICRLDSRILHLLPPEIDGGKLVGINARFRVYRYVPGSIYRPHLDGAAPPSGLSSSGAFQFDTSPVDAPQMSRLTFLIYLNDHFTNGCTTFFLPSPHQIGRLDAYPVKPLMGAALVFPHGDSKGSLLHEGSPVMGEGEAKYVIRTEVVYQVAPSVGGTKK